MFWFAAPILIGLGKIVYDAVTDDDSGSSSYSDREDRERDVKRRVREEKKETIQEEIKAFKKRQAVQIERKYGVTISFDSHEGEEISPLQWIGGDIEHKGEAQTTVSIVNKDETIQNNINLLKDEVKEIEGVIKELKGIRNEALK